MLTNNGPSNGQQPERRDGEVRIDLGRVCATPGALAAVDEATITASLYRHAVGDWGDLDAVDKVENDRAVVHGGRLVSSFLAQNGTKFWIITEADRSATTVLLPEDY